MHQLQAGKPGAPPTSATGTYGGRTPDEETQTPARVRYQAPLTLFPFVMGVVTAIPLWGREAPPIFFATAAEPIALGAVGMALQGCFFRVGAVNRTLWVRSATRRR